MTRPIPLPGGAAGLARRMLAISVTSDRRELKEIEVLGSWDQICAMAKGKKKLRMLWLNDELSFQELIKTVMAEHKLTKVLDVEWVLDGDQAMRSLKKSPPDIFAADVCHPGASFEKLVDHITKSKMNIPICCITGLTNFPKLPNLSSQHYIRLTVPFGLESLQATLNQAIKVARASK